MIIRHTKDQVAEYYTKVGLNQSALKILMNDGVQKFLEEYQGIPEEYYYGEKEYFIKGQAVDTYFSYGEEVFNSSYFISRLTKKPSDTIMSMLHQIFDTARSEFAARNPDVKYQGSLSDDDLTPIIIEAINAHNYQSNWKLDTKINKVLTEGTLYYEELINSFGMQMLSEEEATTIHAILDSFNNHPNVKNLFVDNEDEDIIYQLPIYFRYKDVDCKCLPDIIRVNHKTKVIKVWDIKTLYDYICNIHRVIRMRRYDFQGAYYLQGLHSSYAKEAISNLLGKDVKDYNIGTFGIIGQSTKVISTPLAVNFDIALLEVGKNGSGNIKGFDQAIAEFKFWEEKGFDLDSLDTQDEAQGLISKDFDLLFAI